MKIILADDERYVRLGIKAMLLQLWPNAEIREASNGEQILKIENTFQADYILADIKMPKMSGLEALERWNKRTETQWIILSGYSEFEYARKCIQYDVTDYLLKPVSFQELKNVMERGEQIRAKYHKERIDKVKNEFVRCLHERDKLEYFHMEGTFKIGFILFKDGNLLNQYSEENERDKNKIENVCEKITGVCKKNFWIKRTWNEYMIICFGENELDDIQRKIGFELDNLRSTLKEAKLTIYKTDICENEYRLFKEISQIENLKYLRCIYGFGENINMIKLKTDLTEGEINCLILAEKIEQFISAYYNQDFVQCIQIIHSIEKIMPKVHMGVEERKKLMIFFKTTFDEKIDDILSIAGVMNDVLNNGTFVQLDQKGDNLIESVKNFIDENYHEEINVQWLAEKFHVSANYLSSRFKKVTSLNLIRYVNELRMREAEYLIKNSTLSIKSICEKVGFSSTRYFTKLFIDMYGCYPSDIRKRIEMEE